VLNNHKSAARKGKVQLINATDLHGKMRKSLGSKRKRIEDAQADEIVKLYGQFEAGRISKIFHTEAFGFRRITVERPLQLAFHPRDPDRRDALEADKAWAKLTPEEAAEVLAKLDALPEMLMSRDAFADGLGRLPAARLKLLCKHLGEHNEEAEVCRDKKGGIEVDPDLRDFENVPLCESIWTYFQREVEPHVPDAWIDEGKTDPLDGKIGIVGYEIPFNRHFYEYTPPRPLKEIDRDLAEVSGEIMELLREMGEA